MLTEAAIYQTSLFGAHPYKTRHTNRIEVAFPKQTESHLKPKG